MKVIIDPITKAEAEKYGYRISALIEANMPFKKGLRCKLRLHPYVTGVHVSFTGGYVGVTDFCWLCGRLILYDVPTNGKA